MPLGGLAGGFSLPRLSTFVQITPADISLCSITHILLVSFSFCRDFHKDKFCGHALSSSAVLSLSSTENV